jgi:hypothetical protein
MMPDDSEIGEANRISRRTQSHSTTAAFVGQIRVSIQRDTTGNQSSKLATLLVLLPSCFLLACGAANTAASPSQHPTNTAAMTPSPTPVPTPIGGPAPAQLLGVWVLQPPDPNPMNNLTLTLDATTFTFNITPTDTSSGDIVVNGSEIDFFNGADCHRSLPDGVGRYQWTLANKVLHFTPLGQDPCGQRADHLSSMYKK